MTLPTSPGSLEKLVLALNERLKRMAPEMGWDQAGATRLPRDPAGKIRLSYLHHQGTFLVHVDDARDYYGWLAAGNAGTVVKWAREVGRRLKK